MAIGQSLRLTAWISLTNKYDTNNKRLSYLKHFDQDTISSSLRYILHYKSANDRNQLSMTGVQKADTWSPPVNTPHLVLSCIALVFGGQIVHGMSRTTFQRLVSWGAVHTRSDYPVNAGHQGVWSPNFGEQGDSFSLDDQWLIVWLTPYLFVLTINSK